MAMQWDLLPLALGLMACTLISVPLLKSEFDWPIKVSAISCMGLLCILVSPIQAALLSFAISIMLVAHKTAWASGLLTFPERLVCLPDSHVGNHNDSQVGLVVGWISAGRIMALFGGLYAATGPFGGGYPIPTVATGLLVSAAGIATTLFPLVFVAIARIFTLFLLLQTIAIMANSVVGVRPWSWTDLCLLAMPISLLFLLFGRPGLRLKVACKLVAVSAMLIMSIGLVVLWTIWYGQ